MPGLPDDIAESEIDNITLRVTASATYLALAIDDPGTTGPTLDTLNEIVDDGYVRQPVTWDTPAVPEEGLYPVSDNSNQIIFGPFPSGMLEGAGFMVLVDAASGTVGKVRYSWALDQAGQADPGESLVVAPGAVSVGLGNA